MTEKRISKHGMNMDLNNAYKLAEQRFSDANPKSWDQYRVSCNSMPGGNTRTGMYYAPYPLSMSHGKGAHIWDLDGHNYLDYAGDFSAGLFGHSNSIIHAEMEKALHNGLTFGSTSPHEARLATLICERLPSIERLRFCNSGTEANIMALVTANAVTQKKKIMVFDGAYHGGTLSFPHNGSPINVPFEFIMAPYNDVERTAALFEQYGSTLSAILVETMQGAGGCIPGNPEFLTLLREKSSEYEAILIFDEVMTSRLGANGRQGALGIIPDMTTLGKYVGGGMTAGAFGGRADIMAHYDPRNPDHFVHHGTFNNNVISLAGGAAGLGSIYTADVADKFTNSGEHFRQRLNALGKNLDLPFQATGYGTLMNIHFVANKINSQRDLAKRNLVALDLFHLNMIEAGIYITRRGYMALNLALTDENHDYFLEQVEKFLDTHKLLLEA